MCHELRPYGKASSLYIGDFCILTAHACIRCHPVILKIRLNTYCGMTISLFLLFRRIHEFRELHIVRTCLLLSTFEAMMSAISSRLMIFRSYIFSIMINCAFACRVISSMMNISYFRILNLSWTLRENIQNRSFNIPQQSWLHHFLFLLPVISSFFMFSIVPISVPSSKKILAFSNSMA